MSYERYGPEWEKEMMRLNKRQLIAMFLKARQDKDKTAPINPTDEGKEMYQEFLKKQHQMNQDKEQE